MKQNLKRGERNKVGAFGEAVASQYLEKKGFKILETNYLKKWGEIDIVARGTDQKVHFIEVKTVSYETKADLERTVSYGTWRPEENVNDFKIRKMARTIETWILENDYDGDWQIDVVGVRIVPTEKVARVKYIENIIFG